MSGAQRRSYETLGPLFCINNDIPQGAGDPLDFEEIFGNTRPVIVEIGFGMGMTTALIAKQNQDLNYLGIEVHRPGIGRLLWEIEKRELKNVRIIEGDAADVLERRIKEHSVKAFHIFFPDPWPKKRHQKRRLMTRPFTDLLASRLVPGGYIYMVTDWAAYGDWALRELLATPGLANKYETFAPRQTWRPETKFESKGIMKNREIQELYFVKTERPGEERHIQDQRA
jgi:tRNA (guanine-N7-)-methyltransferase